MQKYYAPFKEIMTVEVDHKFEGDFGRNSSCTSIMLGCNGENHAVSVATDYFTGKELVHATFEYSKIIGRCHCVYPVEDTPYGFIVELEE